MPMLFRNTPSRNIHMPAFKPIRRSQLISPFGIGAMVDFPKDESLMPAGLDAWPASTTECPPDSGWKITEERLQARLGVSHFRMPPDHRDSDRGESFANVNVPFVRFPRWHYCHRCGRMGEVSLFGTPEYCRGGEETEFERRCKADYAKIRGKRPRSPQLIPVRFVAVCKDGHIEDFPFATWAHHPAPLCDEPRLKMRGGLSSAGLTGITIACDCGKAKSLGGIFSFDEKEGGPLAKIDCNCRGLRPWLGEQERSDFYCGKALRVVQRGASNVYFANVVSSLYLPLWAEQADDRNVIRALEDPRIWSMLSQSTVNGKVQPIVVESVAMVCGLDRERLADAAQRKLDSTPPPGAGAIWRNEEEFRQSEYQALLDARGGEKTELYIRKANLGDYAPWVSRYFSEIRLVHKLRETRALAGFSRIFPPDGDQAAQGGRELKLDPRIDWLPAIKVYGEGIFLKLNESQVSLWLESDARNGEKSGIESVLSRVARLSQQYNRGRAVRGQPQRVLSPKFVLLHTLAHIIINQLSFDCGYGSAALRERLYCDSAQPDHPMCGVLIYTASGDSEGTMGGLVRQGRPVRLEDTLLRALRHAGWCSSDPVCLESTGQGADSANLAACHGCCLLPETSCEEGNRILDRALLVGRAERASNGFFVRLLEENT